jgi:hypothetical protein
VEPKKDIPPNDKEAKTLDGNQGFGAYGGGLGEKPGIAVALEPESTAKKTGSLDFADSDKRWLKDIGLTTTNPSDYTKAWASNHTLNQKHRWAQTYGGRLAIRSVSRGIVGAAFFAMGNMYVREAMGGYDPTKKLFDLPKELHKKPLQLVAQIIDKTVGKGIYETTKLISGEEAARNAVTFRPTRSYGYVNPGYAGRPAYKGGLKGVKSDAGQTILVGRSLGHEAMAITFDFASMSFGDYMTRYVLGFFDPNAKIAWMKDGHIDVPGALKDVLHNLFTAVTYAAGEDIAVAIPYVYGVRMQRNIIDKFSPGFRYDSDRALNGGSFKVNDAGHIVGDYQMEGMLDLMGRFSWYNVGTKMFRDTYAHAGDAYGKWWHGDRKLSLPQLNPNVLTPSHLVDTAQTFTRYVARTIIKVMIYMLPATAFFFVTRTPQSKFFGGAIHPEKGILGKLETNFKTGIPKWDSVRADIAASRKDGKAFSDWPKGKFYLENKTDVENPFSTKKHSQYEYRFETFSKDIYTNGHKAPWYNNITNAIGQFCYDLGSGVNQALQGVKKRLGLHIDGDTINDFSRKFANASISYTPYFMAKTDLGSTSWDTKRMDMAIDRMLNGFSHFRAGDVIGGGGEIYRSMIGQPFSNPERELKAKEAMKRDAERGSNEGFQLVRGRRATNRDENADDSKEDQLFRERTASETKRQFATADKKSVRPTLTELRQTTAPKPREGSWATQEAANKAEIDSRNQTIH